MKLRLLPVEWVKTFIAKDFFNERPVISEIKMKHDIYPCNFLNAKTYLHVHRTYKALLFVETQNVDFHATQ